jgi:hypothetical protein
MGNTAEYNKGYYKIHKEKIKEKKKLQYEMDKEPKKKYYQENKRNNKNKKYKKIHMTKKPPRPHKV